MIDSDVLSSPAIYDFFFVVFVDLIEATRV